MNLIVKLYDYIDRKHEMLKNISQVLALILAGLFFALRLKTGWFDINMDMRVELERSHSIHNFGQDNLVAKVYLEKGGNGKITLNGGELHITRLDNVDNQSKTIKLAGLQHLNICNNTVSWDNVTSDTVTDISPGEKLQLAGYVHVPHDAVCKVEIVVFGKNFPVTEAQWRTTSITLPTPLSKNQ